MKRARSLGRHPFQLLLLNEQRALVESSEDLSVLLAVLLLRRDFKQDQVRHVACNVCKVVDELVQRWVRAALMHCEISVRTREQPRRLDEALEERDWHGQVEDGSVGLT